MDRRNAAAELLDVVGRGVRVIDLGHKHFKGMPQSLRHPSFEHIVTRRHGDRGAVRVDGSSGATDMVITGTHVGTHIDALAHISQDGRLYGGVSAEEAQCTGRFTSLGVETIEPFVCRGIFLDIPRLHGVDRLPGGYAISKDDVVKAAASAGRQVTFGCVVLIRTGWGSNWSDAATYMGAETGVPGVGEDAAEWLASFRPRAVGTDTIAFDVVPPHADPMHFLPSHRVLLVENGIHIIEVLDLEGIAVEGITEFLFVLSPLKITGATASPARPLAIVGAPA